MTDLPEMPTGQRLGLAWFSEADWPAWLAMDEHFQPDYQRWLTRNEEMLKQYEAAGNVVVKVPMNPATFEAWRAVTGHGTDARARSIFVAQQMLPMRRPG